jgi:hypothetical protein
MSRASLKSSVAFATKLSSCDCDTGVAGFDDSPNLAEICLECIRMKLSEVVFEFVWGGF